MVLIANKREENGTLSIKNRLFINLAANYMQQQISLCHQAFSLFNVKIIISVLHDNIYNLQKSVLIFPNFKHIYLNREPYFKKFKLRKVSFQYLSCCSSKLNISISLITSGIKKND